MVNFLGKIEFFQKPGNPWGAMDCGFFEDFQKPEFTVVNTPFIYIRKINIYIYNRRGWFTTVNSFIFASKS